MKRPLNRFLLAVLHFESTLLRVRERGHPAVEDLLVERSVQRAHVSICDILCSRISMFWEPLLRKIRVDCITEF